MVELTWTRATVSARLPHDGRASDFPERRCHYCHKWVAAGHDAMVREDGQHAHRSCWLTHNACDLPTRNRGALTNLPTCCRIHRREAIARGEGAEGKNWRDRR